MDSRALGSALELGIWTPRLCCGPYRWRYKLSCFSVTFTVWCGPCSWGCGLPGFGVARRVGDMDFRTLVWPLELKIWTPKL